MKNETTTADIHRLLDMVVEEVSLVDRAANKQRFLIVKRSDEMNKNKEQTPEVADTKESIGNTGEANASQSDTPSKEPEGKIEEEAKQATQDSSTLEAAVSALQSLTEAVELLGNAGDENVQSRMQELAAELRTVAERLAAESGVTEVPNSENQGAGAIPDLETLIGSVKETLARVSDLLFGQDKKARDSKEDERIAPVVEELRTLTTTVKQQQQRLAKLEKNFGLPSSVPAGENQRHTETEDVGWPLDMNRACDRDSVDKSVSFHDV